MPPFGARGLTWSFGSVRSQNIDARTAAKLSPLIMKHQPVPIGSTRIPASAGPKIRLPVITAVLSDIAFAISDGSTSSTTNPRRAGLSNALTTPRTSDMP